MNFNKTSQVLLSLLLALALGCEGPAGEDGAVGDPGEAGPQGDTGSAGPQGDTGSQGETGEAGPQGETGEAGPQGDTGEAGPQGDSGADGVCAGVERLEILNSNFPARLYEGDTQIIAPETNSADLTSLRFAFAGAGLDLNFADNLDGTYVVSAGEENSLPAPAFYTITVTDGCSVATDTIAVGGIYPIAAYVSVVNLTDTRWDLLASKGDDSYQLWSPRSFETHFATNVALPVGESTFYLFNTAFFTSRPDDYDPDDLVSLIEGVTLELDGNYIAYILQEIDGNYTVDFVEVERADEGFVSVNVNHFAAGADPVNIVDFDTGMVAAADLAYGASTGSISLAIRDEPYNFGLDLDGDSIIDARVAPLDLSEAETGDAFDISAYLTQEGLNFFVVLDTYDDFFGFSLAPYVPVPETIEELIAILPYGLGGGYTDSENANIDDPSSFSLSAPGAGAIRLQITYSTERCCDDVIIKDGDDNTVFIGAGDGSADVIVPGESFLVGVDSDSSVTYPGWTITGVEVLTPEAIAPAVAFCELFDTTCSPVNVSIDDCLIHYYDAPAGEPDAVGGRSQACYDYHLNIATNEDPAIHCPHARGDAACVD